MRNLFKKTTSQQKIFFLFFILSTLAILTLSAVSHYASSWTNQQLQRDAGAIGRIGFGQQLSDDERDFIRKNLKGIPFSEQKSFAGITLQDKDYLLTEIHIFYDPYPLTQKNVKIDDGVIYINQPLKDKLHHTNYLSLGSKSFSDIQLMQQTFYWSTTEIVWPVIWISPKTAEEIGLFNVGSRYQHYFYVNTLKLPENLQKYVDHLEGSFDLFSDQKNIVSDLVKLTKYCSDWFFVSLIFIQTIALWLLLVNYQKSEKARIFFINWFSLKWPYRHFLLKKSFIIFSIITFLITAFLKFFSSNLYSLSSIILGQYLFIALIVAVMSLPIFFNRHHLYSFLICIACSFLWANQLNPAKETWLYSMIFMVLGFLFTMLILLLFGYLASLSNKFLLSILGRFWSRKAIDESWPVSGLISSLILTIVGAHLVFYFSTILHQPLNGQQPDFFAINLPINFELENIKDIHIEEYKICRPKLISIDGTYVKQTRSDPKPGREGIYRPLNSTAMNSTPHENLILEGTWPAHQDDSKLLPLLVADSFAKKLNINMDSILEFDFGDVLIKGQVKAIQQVQWESMKPNFFVIFPENSVSDYFESTMIAVKLAHEKKSDFILDLILNYPSITIFDIDGIKKIALKWIDPLLTWIYAVSGSFFFSLFLFSVFIKKLYPTEFIPHQLELVISSSEKKNFTSSSFLIKNLVLTAFVMLSSLFIFIFGQWSWLGGSTLIYSGFSLLMSSLFCFFLLNILE